MYIHRSGVHHEVHSRKAARVAKQREQVRVSRVVRYAMRLFRLLLALCSSKRT